MIPELNIPISFAGRDGFYWWIGQVEPYTDPKEGSIKNRYKVRIVGQHVKSCDAIKPQDLPWAQVLMPVTHPINEGNDNYTPIKLREGDWVIGFFLDGEEGQHPVIIGQLPKTTNSSETKGVTTNVADSCLAFERRVSVSNPNRSIVTPAGTSGPKAPDTNQSDKGTTTATGGATALAQAGNAVNSENNQAGRDICVQVASVPCKTNNGTEQSRFEVFLSEMLYNIQSSGGSFGEKILSPYSGQLLDYAAAGQAYVSKLFGVARAYINGAKGAALGFIKQGVAQLLQWMLGFQVDPVTGKKTKIGIFGQVTQYLNEQLGLINCTFADLEKKIFDFLFNLITDLLLTAVSAATCKIESIINDVLNELLSFLDNSLLAILGPLQSLLSIIESPLNILGAALSFLLDLLGIECSGPGDCKDASTSKFCTGKAQKKPLESELNALDDLIAAAEGLPFDPVGLQTSCTDYLYLDCPAATAAAVTGGTPDPDGFTGEDDELPEDDTDDFMNQFIAGFILGTPTSATTESGGTSTFTVRLRTQPTASVTATITSQSTSEGTVSPSTLTFTTSNWSTEQTVTVTGVDDTFFDGDVQYTIRVTGTSTDNNYNNIIDFLEIINRDNEVQIVNNSFVVLSEDDIAITGTSTVVKNFPTNQFIISSSTSASLNASSTYNFIPTVTTETLNTDYTLTADKTTVNEGGSITFTLTALNNDVPDGTEFNYLMFGFIQVSDFEDNTTIGTMKMFNNVATKTIKISKETSVVSTTDVTFNVAIANRSKLFTIVNLNPTPTTPTPTPTFKPPVLGDPEVDDDGKVIDIPILEPGDPYILPPLIKVYGEGVGAVAIAELDITGSLKKIKVLRPGRGYVPNRRRGNCVIDGYNLIKPGYGYTYEPKVYIDGDANVARAIVKNGSVIGLDIIDKTKTFAKVPRVQIVGDGAGAIIIPTFTCLDKPGYQEYVSNIAPSGTDSVIDCP
jgi:hypothetical protein